MVLLYSPLSKPSASESSLSQKQVRFGRSQWESEHESNPDVLEQQRQAQALELIHRPRANYYLHKPLF